MGPPYPPLARECAGIVREFADSMEATGKVPRDLVDPALNGANGKPLTRLKLTATTAHERVPRPMCRERCIRSEVLSVGRMERDYPHLIGDREPMAG